MRLDARSGDTNWFIFHVPTAKELTPCIMVDDDTCTYELVDRAAPITSWFEFPTRTYKAKKIKIIPPKRLVLIDPVEDDDAEPREVAEEMQPGTPQFEAWVSEDKLY